MVSQCLQWQEKDLPTIAIICRDQESAGRTAVELGKRIDIMETDPEKAEFGNGIMVLPVEYTKGLEFDAVLILNPTREEYPVDDGHAKLLYVAATRALHELCVMHTGNLTGLIADPIPEKAGASRDGADPQDISSRKEDGQDTASHGNIPQGNELQGIALHGMDSGESDRQGMASQGMASPENGLRKEAAAAENVSKGNSSHNIKKPRPVAASPANTLKVRTASPSDPTSLAASIVQTYGNSRKNLASHGNPEAVRTRQTTGHGSPTPGVADKIKKINFPDFGDYPPTEKLRPAGHTRIDLSVRWVTKQPDGLYLQSRYGILRLSPVGSGIVRVTFAKGGKLLDGFHPQIKVQRLEKFWFYKESGQAVTLSTDELLLQVDKSSGAIRYFDHSKQLLLSERNRECRLQEPFPGGELQSWLFLEPAKKEQLFAVGPGDRKTLPLRGTARYISNAGSLPFLFSDQGYGILIASDSPVVCCDIPAYGTYLHTENEAQMDYYFIAGKKPETLMNACRFLRGEL